MLTREQMAEGGRKSAQVRRRQTAREIAEAATTAAIERILTDPPELTPAQRERLRALLAVEPETAPNP